MVRRFVLTEVMNSPKVRVSKLKEPIAKDNCTLEIFQVFLLRELGSLRKQHFLLGDVILSAHIGHKVRILAWIDRLVGRRSRSVGVLSLLLLLLGVEYVGGTVLVENVGLLRRWLTGRRNCTLRERVCRFGRIILKKGIFGLIRRVRLTSLHQCVAGGIDDWHFLLVLLSLSISLSFVSAITCTLDWLGGLEGGRVGPERHQVLGDWGRFGAKRIMVLDDSIDLILLFLLWVFGRLLGKLAPLDLGLPVCRLDLSPA